MERELKDANSGAIEWRDMNPMVAILGRHNFFVGSEIPETATEAFKRFGLHLGVSASDFVNLRRRNHSLTFACGEGRSNAGPRKIKEENACPVSSMFIDRHVLQRGQVNWTPDFVENITSSSGYEINSEGASVPGVEVMRMDPLNPEKLRDKRRKAAAARKKPSRLSPEELLKLRALVL